MERRAHWSDDLIDAVRDAVDVEFDDIWKLSDDSILAVIAAVEDWHKAKRDSRVRTHSEGCWRWHNECAESLIEWQQAAIQRVREIHRQSHFSNECIECAPGGTYYWPCPTVEALADGAS